MVQKQFLYSLPTIRINLPQALDPRFDQSKVSNFVYIPTSPGYYVFAYGTQVYKVLPDRLAIERYRFGLDASVTINGTETDILGPCIHLVYDGNLLTAYCKQHSGSNITVAVRYNIELGDWRNTQLDIPYYCPAPNSNVTTYLLESKIQYRQQNDQNKRPRESPRINITGYHLYSGICFSSENHPIFAFLDRVEGLHVVNISSGEEKNIPLPNGMCIGHSLCEILLIYVQQYLIVRQKQPVVDNPAVIVLDTQQNYSTIVISNTINPALISVISSLYINVNPSDPSTPEVIDPSQDPGREDTESQGSFLTIVIGIVILVIVVGVTSVFVIPIVIIWIRYFIYFV